MIDAVLQAKTYTDLPIRSIIKSPYIQHPVVSYGLIPYARNSKRWLIVQRRNTQALILLLRGAYRNAHLPTMCKHMTVDEANLVRSIYRGDIYFEAVYIATLGNAYMDDMIYGQERFLLARRIIERCLLGKEEPRQPEWLWPKGRLQFQQEDPIACAFREFKEETGITATEGKLLPFPITERIIGVTGRVYETVCWIYAIDEVPVTKADGNIEIRDRRWVTVEEATALLPPSRVNTLDQAVRLIGELAPS